MIGLRRTGRILLTGLLICAMGGLSGCKTTSQPAAQVKTADVSIVDTDGDHIPDATEIEMGLDPKSIDSDRDGRSDYHEVFGIEPRGAQSATDVSTEKPVPLAEAGTAGPRIIFASDTSTAEPLAHNASPSTGTAGTPGMQVPRHPTATHVVASTPETLPDSDGDDTADPLDGDHDNDGVNDGDVNDRDADGVPDGWETNGWYVKSGIIMPYLGDVLPTSEVYYTDPDQQSTDRDAYPDGVEGVGGLSISRPGNHPLVPAVPEIVAHLTAVDVTLDQQITTEGGGKSQTTWTNAVEDLSTTTKTHYGDKTLSAAKAVPYVGAASKAVSWIPGASKLADTFSEQAVGSLSLAQTDDVKSTTEHRVKSVAGGLSESDWRTVTQSSMTSAAKVTLSVELENVGLLDASSVTPEATLLIAGSAAQSGLVPRSADGKAATDIPAGQKKSVAVSAIITMGQLIQVELGAPISVQVDKLTFGDTTGGDVSKKVPSRSADGTMVTRTVTYSTQVDWAQTLQEVKRHTTRLVVDRGDEGTIQTRVYATSLYNGDEDAQTLPMSVWHAMWCAYQAYTEPSTGAIKMLVNDGQTAQAVTASNQWTWYCAGGLSDEVASNKSLNGAVMHQNDYAVMRTMPSGTLVQVRNASFRKGACLVEAQSISKLGLSSMVLSSAKGGPTTTFKAPTSTEPYYTLVLDPDFESQGDEVVYAVDISGNKSASIAVAIPSHPGWDFDALRPPTVILGKGLTEAKAFPSGTYGMDKKLSEFLPAGYRLHSIALHNPNSSPIIIEKLGFGQSVFHPHQKAGDWVLGADETRVFRIGGYGKIKADIFQWIYIPVPKGNMGTDDFNITWAPLQPPNVVPPTLESVDCTTSWQALPAILGNDFIDEHYYRASTMTVKNNDPKHPVVVYGMGSKTNSNFSTIAWRDAATVEHNYPFGVSKYIEDSGIVQPGTAKTFSWPVYPRPSFGDTWASQAWRGDTQLWLTWPQMVATQVWPNDIAWYDGPLVQNEAGWMYGPTPTVSKSAWDQSNGKVLAPSEFQLHYYASDQLRTTKGNGE